MQLIPIVVVLFAATLASVLKYYRDSSLLAGLAPGGGPTWKVGLLSFLGTLIGVVISIFVAEKGQFQITPLKGLMAFIGAVVANLGTFALMKKKNALGYLDFFTFVKDGFLWSTTYPAIAKLFE